MLKYGYDIKRHSVTPGIDRVISCFAGGYGFEDEETAVREGLCAAKKILERLSYCVAYIEIYAFDADNTLRGEICPIAESRAVYVYDDGGIAHADDDLPTLYSAEKANGRAYRIDDDCKVSVFEKRVHPGKIREEK